MEAYIQSARSRQHLRLGFQGELEEGAMAGAIARVGRKKLRRQGCLGHP